ncbi:YpiF family protein [Priestia flexa]|uniref:YpiF family protein n=1 Tax=Priestia flexa TaxID=86664 RepID=UPI001C987097|nr:YpiF family protein [Priestia flexa]MBY6084922.1 YpiF family protein [Priestia flexa]
MKWHVKDVELYLQSKEYVDSIIIPLIPIDFGAAMKTTAAMNEYTTIITSELERQFKGRVLLAPSFTYLKQLGAQHALKNLIDWKNQVSINETKHIFFLTNDRDWIAYDQELESKLIWIPTLPLEHMEEAHKQRVVADQIEQIIPDFLEKWKS